MPRLTIHESQATLDTTLRASASAADVGDQEAQALIKGGAQLQQVADRQARTRAARSMSTADLDWRRKLIDMQNDPEFATKYGEDGSGFADAFKLQFEDFATKAIGDADPAARGYVEEGMYNLGESLMAHSLDYQAQVAAGYAVDTVTSSIDNARQSASMAPEQFTSIMANANLVIDEISGLDMTTRRRMKEAALAEVTVGAATSLLETGGVDVAHAINNNTLKFNVEEDGKISAKSIRDLVDEDVYAALKGQADTTITKAEAVAREAVDLEIDNIETDIELAETPQEFIAAQERIKKSSPAFNQEQINSLKVKYHKKTKTFREEIRSVDRGNAFASGQAYLNPTDKDAVKDYNNWYDARMDPMLNDMPVDERNTRLANLLSETKIIPDRLKGDIKYAARSQKPEVIGAAADFLNRLSNTNPHMVNAFVPKDVARINMVNNLLAVGYTPEEASNSVDQVLAPANDAIISQRKEELRGKTAGFFKKDYKADALDVLRPGFLGRLLPGDSIGATTGDLVTRQIAQLTSDYQRAYDNHYLLTGDAGEADKHASTVLRSQYAVSKVNGGRQIMRHAPETYLSIPGINNKWMREQVIAEAKTKLFEGDGFLLHPKFDVDKDVVLVPDPKVTPRTAAAGQPAYKIMMKAQDGTLQDVLGAGNFFVFDAQQAKDEAVNKVRRRKELEEQLAAARAKHPASLEVNQLRDKLRRGDY